MKEKAELLQKVTDHDERIFFSSLLDKLEQSDQRKYPVFSDFLDAKQVALAAKLFRCYQTQLSFHGGIRNAERQICYLSFGDESVPDEDVPIVLLAIFCKDAAELTHRDVLGALMGLGIKRQKIGDIVMGDPIFVAVKEEIAAYIRTNLTSVGRYPVQLKTMEGFFVEKKQAFSFRSATVASLRMDCIVAEILHLSREKAKAFILANQVRVNHLEESNYKKLLSEGDLLSISHKGRFSLEQVAGLSKKDRVKIIIKKYE